MPNDYDALKQMMEASIRKSAFKTSKEMKEVMNALKDVCALREQQVGSNTQQMVTAHERLGKACELYTSTRQNAKTNKGKTRLDLVDAIHSLQQRELGAMRSPKFLRENQGKTWNDVLASQREKTIDITGKELRTVGAGSSTRYVVDMGGDIGFFSEEATLKTKAAAAFAATERITDPVARALATNAAENADNNNPNSPYDELIGYYETAESIAKTSGTDLYDAFSSEFSQSSSRSSWAECSDSGKKEVMNFAQEMKKYETLINTMGKTARIKDGSNISNRNVASTRLAELFGQENLMARSEKLCLNNGGQKIHGVVMARANGLDINSKNPEDIQKFHQPIDFTQPEFQRQITSLEIMDLLAGQVDRHPGNMFYQFGDMKDGVRPITGIQGIDNDAAFGLKTNLNVFTDKVTLNDLSLIDADLKRNLLNMNRDMLDYTFGDLLNKSEIDAMENRLTQLQEHAMNHMTEMQPEDWNKDSAEKLMKGNGYLSNVAGIINQNLVDSMQQSKEQQAEGPKATGPAVEQTEKPKEQQVEHQTPEKHERKELSLNDLEKMVKSEKTNPKWEKRSPTLPFKEGRSLTGQPEIGQHRRTDLMKPSPKSGPSK